MEYAAYVTCNKTIRMTRYGRFFNINMFSKLMINNVNVVLNNYPTMLSDIRRKSVKWQRPVSL